MNGNKKRSNCSRRKEGRREERKGNCGRKYKQTEGKGNKQQGRKEKGRNKIVKKKGG